MNSASDQRVRLNQDPPDILGAPIIELRRSCRGVVGHGGGFFERAAVFQIRRDSRRPKGVIADPGGDPDRPLA